MLRLHAAEKQEVDSMPGFLGNVIVGLILAAVVGLAIRSLWRSHKSGGSCSGDCSNCKHCHHK
jgi:hypothetical protein